MALIGICGAHRTGKSTLAKEWAKKHDFHYVDADVRSVIMNAGLDPKTIQSAEWEYFIFSQALIMRHLVNLSEEYAKSPEIYVMDRTPLDALAYWRCYFNSVFFAHIRKDMENDEAYEFLKAKMRQYVKHGHEATALFYTMTVLVQPGIPIVECDTSAQCDEIYIDNLNNSILGDIQTVVDSYRSFDPNIYIIGRNIVNFEDRLLAMDSFWLDAQEIEKEQADFID